MAEISREEAIMELDVMGGNCSTAYDFIVCHKAISDMEKLEKIEHELYLINNAEFEIPNNAYTFLDRIEQIIKG